MGSLKLHTCRICGFSYYSRSDSNICDDCAKKAEFMYQEIAAYLRRFPNSNAMQISNALHIPAYDVLTFLENGSLERSRGTLSPLPDVSDDTKSADTTLQTQSREVVDPARGPVLYEYEEHLK